ncbi:TetR/AcrR family transcriptional regulator [Actinoplanes teichomyceticus]|uniref:TetR family transcriptional regulator n=1 Tax=Actinoplanes teichomyceticus TaxID=1867 RepID=A0A561VCU0_ACTTI|nr:TetR/AcrR family transcriptional regulator [Actinoplanes teichomyceticus]TWG09431.1 TetR family transcriptional regulator [Actinoplanes teichomyceticus]GIF17094.1 TetR family transcriptional regulator [Actinoplanes teichomyceticus]
MAASATTRAQIVEAADRLFYEQGFEHTSFTAIAEAVGISRGNFYYHFRTKDEILAAVIDSRVAATRAMLRRWAAETPDPAQRIRLFIHIVLTNGADIRAFGCPVGTLTAELAKLRHPARPEAVAVFTLFRAWLADQFAALGHEPGAADAKALHVLAFSQGVAALANAFGEEDFVHREVARLERWLADSPARRTGATP